jgi:segregation and condensation protein B
MSPEEQIPQPTPEPQSALPDDTQDAERDGAGLNGERDHDPPASGARGEVPQPPEGAEDTEQSADQEASAETALEGDADLPPLPSPAEIKAALEALLFATTEPLSVTRLARILGTVEPQQVRSLLFELQQDYDTSLRGLQIVEVAGGYQMATRPHYAPWIYRLKPGRRRNPLSQATLETLAIIAYKQPVTRAEIEAIRGVDSSATIHNLVELGLIEIGARREVPGRPPLYVTTQQFLKTFGLRSLGDLPSIHELRRTFTSADSAHRETARVNEDAPGTGATSTSGNGAGSRAASAEDRGTAPAQATAEASESPRAPEDAGASQTTAEPAQSEPNPMDQSATTEDRE